MARRNEAQGWGQMSPLCPPWASVPGQRRGENGETHKDGCHLPFCKRKPENLHRCVNVTSYSCLILVMEMLQSERNTPNGNTPPAGDGRRPLHLHPQLLSSTDKKRSFLIGGFIFSCLWRHRGGLFSGSLCTQSSEEAQKGCFLFFFLVGVQICSQDGSLSREHPCFLRWEKE